MASPASPAETRALIVERLVGETGEPDRVTDAARALAERSIPAIIAGISEAIAIAATVELKAVELVRMTDAKPTGDGHAMTVAASTTSPDALVLTVDPEALSTVVCGFFGGDPGLAASPIKRDLSPTEIEVATLLFEEIAKAVNGSGERAFEFKLPLPPALAGAELRKHIIRDGPGVRVTFSVATPAGSGMVALTMPQRVLLKHRGGGAAGADTSPEWRARFNEEVMRSSVQLHATVPLARMTLGDVASLQVGQLIEIDAAARAHVKLSARQKTLFVCEFGKLGQNYTVRVRHPFDAGQEFIEELLPA